MKFERSVAAKPNVDLTPMLDVVFLLLIFFMVSTRFEQLREVPIELPKVGAATAPQEVKNRRVQVSANGALFLDGKPLEKNDLKTALESADRVVLSADKAVSHGVFMDLLTTLRALPIKAVTVEVEDR